MLTFVGVGPGDPELITKKAARVLENADAVACAETSKGESAALRIAAAHIEGKPRIAVRIPMMGMRAEWEAAHRQAAETLLKGLERYPNIAYPVLGDPGIYASSSYLLRLIAPKHPCAVVPGISSINAMAAALGVPLSEQREPLTVLDALEPGAPLPEGNVVVMKCGRQLDALQEACGAREVYVARDLGGEGEWLGRLRDMPELPYSYFTTALVKPRQNGD